MALSAGKQPSVRLIIDFLRIIRRTTAASETRNHGIERGYVLAPISVLDNIGFHNCHRLSQCFG
jgi:hypothetical protein